MGILTRATRNIARRKTRALLVIVALSLALAMIVSIPPSITASQEATQKTIDNLTTAAKIVASTVNMAATQLDCNLPLTLRTDAGPYHNETTFERPLMNITEYSNLTYVQHVTYVVPVLEQRAYDWPYTVYGVPLDDAELLSSYPILLPANITAGRNLQAGDSGVVVLHERIANHFGIAVGETVNIFGRDFEVVGIEGQEALNTTYATMSLSDAQAITNTTGQASTFIVFADSVDNVYAVKEQIVGAYPKLTVTIAQTLLNQVYQMQRQTEEQLQQAHETMNQIESTGIVEMGIITIADSAIILFIMLYTVRERTKEIGTLKALGASNTTILGQFMLEGILLSLIAGIVGIVIGIFGATSLANILLPQPITQTGIGITTSGSGTWGGSGSLTATSISVTITPELMLFGLGFSVLLGALGSLYPAWRAARTRPAEAMRYE
ncbi:MAG: ABC transporter permease [Candidatus Bathyarchaeota archaeon]|nr:ABC transporter permease [Candidatus Bathyarchaeota archaeon]